MLLSGLPLAGANQTLAGHPEAVGDDGILYSLEAAELSLEGTELVALSEAPRQRAAGQPERSGVVGSRAAVSPLPIWPSRRGSTP